MNVSPESDYALVVARQQIEYLRRRYGYATDLLTLEEPGARERGRAIYREIFAPDAEVSATANGEVLLSAKGADDWADTVIQAFQNNYTVTQHLIGTQIVDVHSLPGEKANSAGEATMSSYLQAVHENNGNSIVVCIGTYYDKVRYSADKGWQIYQSMLVRASGHVVEL